jgi:hypothetical protein
MSFDSRLSRLLEHPAIWRGRSMAGVDVVPTGFPALDRSLPGNGWPRIGLVEILIPRLGIGELYLLLPALALLTRRPSARWCAWIAPPYMPFAPALSAQGLALERVLIARTVREASWAFEQALSSNACDAALTWIRRIHPRDIRRLQLAAERGRTLGFMFRSAKAMRESSNAALRLLLQPIAQGARVTLLKSRGGLRGSIDLTWQPAAEA